MLQTGRRVLSVVAVAAMAAAGLIMTTGDGAAASRGSRTVGWTQTGTGAQISQNGSTLVIVSAVTNSLDGDGAVVATVTLNGNSATDTAVRYQANGVGRFEETLTLGAPANGVIPYTGTGKCTAGTGVHKHERCSYTFTGTENASTSMASFKITGTTTR